jgi:hypothetical protein
MLTEHDIDLAERAGASHATVEYELGNVGPNDNPLDEGDILNLALRITGRKLYADSDEAIMLAQAYEDSYYSVWEDLKA